MFNSMHCRSFKDSFPANPIADTDTKYSGRDDNALALMQWSYDTTVACDHLKCARDI